VELNLQPHAPASGASSRPFAEGDRVVSYLVRNDAGESGRHDLHAGEDADFQPAGAVLCRWVHVFRPKPKEENPERTLKLTAENLFLTLADPATEPSPAHTPLLQFLALLLERKRLLRPRGRSGDGERNLFEHMRTHQMYEIPVGDLSPEFFARIQAQLGVLVGGGKPKLEPPPATPPGAATSPPPD
jgi:hypothetical protein